MDAYHPARLGSVHRAHRLLLFPSLFGALFPVRWMFTLTGYYLRLPTPPQGAPQKYTPTLLAPPFATVPLLCPPGHSSVECGLALKHSRWLVLLRKQVQAAPKRTPTPPPDTTRTHQGTWGRGSVLWGLLKNAKSRERRKRRQRRRRRRRAQRRRRGRLSRPARKHTTRTHTRPPDITKGPGVELW